MTIEFHCNKCGHEFTERILLGVSDNWHKTKCPKCGAKCAFKWREVKIKAMFENRPWRLSAREELQTFEPKNREQFDLLCKKFCEAECWVDMDTMLIIKLLDNDYSTSDTIAAHCYAKKAKGWTGGVMFETIIRKSKTNP